MSAKAAAPLMHAARHEAMAALRELDEPDLRDAHLRLMTAVAALDDAMASVAAQLRSTMREVVEEHA